METEVKRDKTMVMAEITTPDMTNFTGNVHGGYLLSMLDKVAYACASRFTGKNIVTLSVDRVFFKEPIHVGELVTCYATVNYVGKTSLEVGIKVTSEKIKTGEVRHTNTCYFTMVCVDDNFKPIPAPELKLETEIDKRRFEEARLRKEARLRFQKMHLENKQKT